MECLSTSTALSNKDLCIVLMLITWSSLIFSDVICTWIHLLLIIWHPLCSLIAFCLFPCSIWNARHAWTLTLTPHSIMILHQREREPITSVHWACKHDICPVLCRLHNCLVTQVLSATRYVKTFRKFIIHPRHGSYGRLEEEKTVCLKTSLICHPSRSWPQHFLKTSAKTVGFVTSWM